MKHRERFLSVWASAGGTANAASGVFEALRRRYDEPQRHYHTWEHVIACLQALDELRDEAENPTAIELALWFHDAVYDPTETDNEAQSAAIARSAMCLDALDPALQDQVDALIRCTESHGEQLSGDEAVISDADLSIFAQDASTFAKYERDVRLEYRAVPEAMYRVVRRKVMQGFALRRRIYRTERGYERWEAAARKNLAACLEQLA